MKIYNGFSQTPTRNFTAAGIDFFVPNVTDNSVQSEIALDALCNSYKTTVEQINTVFNIALECARYDNERLEIIKNNQVNFIHLYYGLKDKVRNIDMAHNTLEEKIEYFVKNILTYDSNGRIGVICKFSDMLFINSGVKVALVPHTSLEFKNKSGKGCQGWSVKACLVDEDYSGYMHLSMQYLWYDDNLGTVYVGDKLTQGTVQNVLTDNAEEISIDEYNNLMKNTQRGANGFGSSDVKH